MLEEGRKHQERGINALIWAGNMQTLMIHEIQCLRFRLVGTYSPLRQSLHCFGYIASGVAELPPMALRAAESSAYENEVAKRLAIMSQCSLFSGKKYRVSLMRLLW